ncbi:Importin subunit beta-1 [Hordeum vulgare]|nr:Importin subunit beta-1 [Hordeum vulgare]
MNVVSQWVHNDMDLAAAWSLNRSVTIVKTVIGRRRRLNGELAKIGKGWLLSDYSANGCHGKAAVGVVKATSSMAAAALRTT